jgi:carboxylesterase type B
VKNYIQYFGGDPEKITLFGESAGGMSVHAHVLSPYNHGIISGAISQSGTMLYNRGLSGLKETIGTGKIAEIFNCSSTNYDEEMLRCLQDVPVQELLERCTTDPESWFDPEASHLMFGPIVDSFASEPFMPLQPLEALRTGVYNKVPFMSGTTKDDGSVLLIPMYDNLEQLSEDWSAFGPQLLSLSEVDEPTIISNILKKYYVGDELSQENKQSVMDMFTDATFLAPDQKTVELMSKQRSPVFNYQLTYKGTNSVGQLLERLVRMKTSGLFMVMIFSICSTPIWYPA